MRYDAADGLSWMAVRAYDPTLGRFISRDPLGRAPLFFAGQPYAYAGNNPVSNVDPSGQYRASGSGAAESTKQTKRHFADNQKRIAKHNGCDYYCKLAWKQHWKDNANQVRDKHLTDLDAQAREYFILGAIVEILGLVAGLEAAVDVWDKLVDIVGILSVVVDNLLPNFGQLAEDKGWSKTAYRDSSTLAAWINGVMSVVTATMAAVRLGGAIGVALGFLEAAAEGVPGLVAKLISSFLAYSVTSLGAWLEGMGDAILANKLRQQQMDISAWCREYGQHACG